MRTVRSALVALVMLALAVPAFGGGHPQKAAQPDTPGPIRFVLEVEVLDPDGSHVVLDGGTFDLQSQAVAEVERITHDGICVYTDPSDPGMAAACYPPARHLRTRVLKIWL